MQSFNRRFSGAMASIIRLPSVLGICTMPQFITTSMGFAFSAAIRLSSMKFFLPWDSQEVSFSPWPCCKYRMG